MTGLVSVLTNIYTIKPRDYLVGGERVPGLPVCREVVVDLGGAGEWRLAGAGEEHGEPRGASHPRTEADLSLSTLISILHLFLDFLRMVSTTHDINTWRKRQSQYAKNKNKILDYLLLKLLLPFLTAVKFIKISGSSVLQLRLQIIPGAERVQVIFVTDWNAESRQVVRVV